MFAVENPVSDAEKLRYAQIASDFAQRAGVNDWEETKLKGSGRVAEAFVTESDEKIIKSPATTTPYTLYIFLHEAGHHFYDHVNNEKPYHVEEYEATHKALEVLEENRIALPCEATEEAGWNIEQAIKKDRKKGIKIEPKAEELVAKLKECTSVNPNPKIKPGDFVKIIRGGESFWVRYTGKSDGKAHGVVDNELVNTSVHGLRRGSKVVLKPSEEVIDVMKGNPAVSPEQYRLAQAVLSGTVRGPSHMSVSVAREIVDRTPARLRSEYSRHTENPVYGMDLDLETTMAPAWKYYDSKKARDMDARLKEGEGKKVVKGYSFFGFSEGGGKKYRMRLADHRGNPKKRPTDVDGNPVPQNYEMLSIRRNQGDALDVKKGLMLENIPSVIVEPPSTTFGTSTGNWSVWTPKKTYKRAVKLAEKAYFDRYPERMQNPQSSADDMYASFHGEPTDETIEFQNEEHYHSHLSALGELVELKVKLVNGGRAVIGFESGSGEDDQVENPQREYKTEASFKKALAKVTADGTLVHWYGTDHGWVIVTKKMVGGGQQHNPFWPFNSFTHSTIYHVGAGKKHGVEKTVKVSVTPKTKVVGEFKGYKIEKQPEGYVAPGLDPAVFFSRLDDVKLFILSIMGGGKLKANPLVDHYREWRASNPGGPLDEHAAKELELYVENDADLYRQQYSPINKNLVTKLAKGIYNHAGAVKLFGYLMESGAKKYAKEYSEGKDWHQIFSPATRKHVAELFARHFETEANLGNYDNLLPKKYADWRKKNPGPFAGTGKLIKRGRRVISKPVDDFLGTAGKVGGYLDSQLGRALNPANKDTGPVILATNEDGNQLFVIGGDQSLDLSGLGITGDMASKESIVIGDITNIVYHTHKVFDGKHEEYDYTHKAGEVTGDLPTLRYDRINCRLHIDGGAYKIDRPLGDTSPGLEN